MCVLNLIQHYIIFFFKYLIFFHFLFSVINRIILSIMSPTKVISDYIKRRPLYIYI